MTQPATIAIALGSLSLIAGIYFAHWYLSTRQERRPIQEFQSKNGLTFLETELDQSPEFIEEVRMVAGNSAAKHARASAVLRKFQLGTCSGVYAMGNREIKVLYVVNEKPGSGHMDDFFEWIEHSARKEGYNIRFCGVEDPRFRRHLIQNKGFMKKGKGDLLKLVR